jgi:hypothetical protein
MSARCGWLKANVALARKHAELAAPFKAFLKGLG